MEQKGPGKMDCDFGRKEPKSGKIKIRTRLSVNRIRTIRVHSNLSVCERGSYDVDQ